jgi:hypothetical protein
LRVKLEGAGKIGERYVGIVGVRDPYTIANLDLVTAWTRQQVVKRFGDKGYDLNFTIYGRNAILGDRERERGHAAMSSATSFRGSPRPRRWPKRCA